MRSIRTARHLRPPILISDRNGAEIFANRARKNLDFIASAASAGTDVHPVTQAVCALMGIIVLPLAAEAFHDVKKKKMDDLYADGWPRWEVTGSKSIVRLNDFVRQLRNAVTHGSIEFDSDSRSPADVTIAFKSKDDDWMAKIKGDALITFCRRVSDALSV